MGQLLGLVVVFGVGLAVGDLLVPAAGIALGTLLVVLWGLQLVHYLAHWYWWEAGRSAF